LGGEGVDDYGNDAGKGRRLPSMARRSLAVVRPVGSRDRSKASVEPSAADRPPPRVRVPAEFMPPPGRACGIGVIRLVNAPEPARRPPVRPLARDPPQVPPQILMEGKVPSTRSPSHTVVAPVNDWEPVRRRVPLPALTKSLPR